MKKSVDNLSRNSVQREKESAAKSGIVGGAILTTVELLGGLVSGSLGLLSSALNTLMDFTASLIAFFAVRKSSKPPDGGHQYGHLKIESFAAVFEIVLLYIVCTWIIFTATVKITTGEARIENLLVGIGANMVSIIVDAFAYIKFKTASKDHGSEALGAGALHFLNDLLIAFIVIAGLILYNFGLWYADSLAAIGVVGLITYFSLDVLKSSIGVLLDAAPRDVAETLRYKILRIEGVKGCHNLRVRKAGNKYFVDAHVEVEGHLPLSRAHGIAEAIESQISEIFPGSDIIIHTEPSPKIESIPIIRNAASEFPEINDIHEITLTDMGEGVFLSYHLEMDSNINLEAAHEIAHKLESRLNTLFKKPIIVVSHLEPVLNISNKKVVNEDEAKKLKLRIIEIAEEYPEIKSIHDIDALSLGRSVCITMHCTVDGAMNLDEAHTVSTKLEEKIKSMDDRVSHVIIHCEPEEA
ncbi:cation-efflux pump [Candidatus Bathyarchaeota archaeon]|nr:cation-efflux pump [Candidatus Bathyarchaeota archaeon]MBS7630093.1 cation-efflux pump [Candidatus Bathyarchaeota archaeon]